MLLLRRRSSKRVPCAVRVCTKRTGRTRLSGHYAVLLRHASELGVKEGVIAGSIGVNSVDAYTCRINESSRGGMLSWKTSVANVSERILSFAGTEESVEPRSVRVHWFLLLLLLLWLLLLRRLRC